MTTAIRNVWSLNFCTTLQVSLMGIALQTDQDDLKTHIIKHYDVNPTRCPMLWINECEKVENKFVNQIIKSYFMFQQNKM